MGWRVRGGGGRGGDAESGLFWRVCVFLGLGWRGWMASGGKGLMLMPIPCTGSS